MAVKSEQGLKDEYVKLAIELGLINEEDVESVTNNIKDITIVSNDKLYVCAINFSDFKRFKRIEYNPELFKNKKYVMNEAVFYLLSGFTTDIYFDLMAYDSKIHEFHKKYYSQEKEDKFLGHNYMGMSLIQYCINQYIAQLMVNKKYNMNTNTQDFILDNTMFPLSTHIKVGSVEDYPDHSALVEAFSKTLYSGEDSMKQMCSDSLKGKFLDHMYEVYAKRDSLEELYDILGMLGIINIIYLFKLKISEGPNQIRYQDPEPYKEEVRNRMRELTRK